LSYSSFEYADLSLEPLEVSVGENLSFKLTLKNIGERAATEVAQFYLSDLEASATVPLSKLVGFSRVTLEPGESRKLQFTLTPEMMSFFDDAGKLTLEPGEFRLEVGGCSPGQRGQDLGAPAPQAALFRVV
jgi:beta-glucosidase